MEIRTEAPRPSGLALLEDEDFVWGRVWPLVGGGAARPPTFEVTIHRNRVDGRFARLPSDLLGTELWARR